MISVTNNSMEGIMGKDIMTTAELGSYLRISYKNVNKMVDDGLTFFTANGKPNGQKRFRREDVDSFIIELSKKLSGGERKLVDGETTKI